MAPEVVSRIFDEGSRAGGAGASLGTGMGLYIAKLLTELQGGTTNLGHSSEARSRSSSGCASTLSPVESRAETGQARLGWGLRTSIASPTTVTR